MRRFYAAPGQFTGSEVVLSLEESKHLRDVLRLRVGDEVSVFDGEGREFRCDVVETGKAKSAAKLEVREEISPPAPESPLDLTLAIALLKGEKFDFVVQKATELGVNQIVPLQTARADVQIKTGDSEKKQERWQRIALEAVKQCGRARIPEISRPIFFSEFIAAEPGQKVLFSERGGQSLNALPKTPDKKITAIVGPEGGWDDSELVKAGEQNSTIVTFGGRILRAETAAVAVCVLLQNLFGDMN